MVPITLEYKRLEGTCPRLDAVGAGMSRMQEIAYLLALDAVGVGRLTGKRAARAGRHNCRPIVAYLPGEKDIHRPARFELS